MTAASQSSDPGAASSRAAWPAILRDTVIEVFATMVGVALTPPDSDQLPILAQVTGMVGIAGPVCATFSLRCSARSATLIASQMLGVSEDEAAPQKCDAVGEICNIVAGYFKAKIGLGDKCMLSVPTVLAGNDYQVRTRAQDVRMELPLVYEREPLWIALDIRP
jgi:chemotaxis protein CheX